MASFAGGNAATKDKSESEEQLLKAGLAPEIRSKVLRYESFLDEQLKPDLESVLTERDKLYAETAEFLALKNSILAIQKAELKPGKRTNFECIFFSFFFFFFGLVGFWGQPLGPNIPGERNLSELEFVRIRFLPHFFFFF